jgi:hypothetical protein
MSATTESDSQIVYWHRELPPLQAEAIGEHTLEATSGRIPATAAHREELWARCQDELMAHTRGRLEQEIDRLGGRYAHVLSEAIDTRHDDVTGEAWLRGRFTYMLYR